MRSPRAALLSGLASLLVGCHRTHAASTERAPGEPSERPRAAAQHRPEGGIPAGATGVTYAAPPGGPVLGVNTVWVGPRTADHSGERAMTAVQTRAELAALGATRFRQLTSGDATWRNIEPSAGAFTWTGADAVIPVFAGMVIPTLFDIQYANPTPPWRRAPGLPFETSCNSDVEAYVGAVVDRYRASTTYWEIGNEMDHWKAADPGGTIPPELANQPGHHELPGNTPSSGYSSAEQGQFLACVARIIHEHEPGAKVVMPGLSGLAPQALDGWLTDVITAAGKDTFDVINYHYYGPWQRYAQSRALLTQKLAELGVPDKPVWLTETGVTSDPTLMSHTNYPNSETEQAADVFRRFSLAFGYGDSSVYWHTFVDSGDDPNNRWRGFGLITMQDRRRTPAWYAYQLFATQVAPFASSTVEEAGPDRFVVRFARGDGGSRWVAWGSGSLELPSGATRSTSVVYTGSAPWAGVSAAVPLTDVPTLIATSR